MRLLSRTKANLLAAGAGAAVIVGALMVGGGTAVAQIPVPAAQDLPTAIRNAQAPSEAPAPAPRGAQSKEAAPDPIAEAAVRIIQRVPAAEKRGLETVMTVSLRDADLAQSVRLLAEEAGVNVVLGKDVQGRVTCNLTNVTARTAMEVILRANGFDFVGANGVLVVVKQSQLKDFTARPQETTLKIRRQVFYLPYTGNEPEFTVTTGAISSTTSNASTGAGSSATANAKKTEDLIKAMLSPVGKLAVYERGHMLVVEDEEGTLAVIAQFVKELWATPPQVFIDTKLVELTLENDETLGINWNASTPLTTLGSSVVGRTTSPSPFSTGDTSFFSYGITSANVNVFLQALATKKRAEIMSNPNVLVVNHRTATIVVGQEIPYLSSTQSQAGSSAINTYEFKEVAVRVEVTPHVADNGMIFMDVHPVVKNVIGYTDAPAQPILSIREALTNVVMQDGTTLIIGGLKGSNINKKHSETPFLARIPLVGLLFQQHADTAQKADLVFLLSPRLLTPELMKQLIAQNRTLIETTSPSTSTDSDVAKAVNEVRGITNAEQKKR